MPSLDCSTPAISWKKLWSADVWDLIFDGTNWWTTEADNNTVTKRDADGAALATFAASLDLARGITWDGADLWIAGDDGTNNAEEILRHATDGTLEATIVTGPQTDANGGVAWDGTHLWLVVGSANQVEQYDASGSLLSSFALPTSVWSGIAAYDGDLFVVDNTNARLLRYTPTGDLVRTINVSGVGASPTGVWIADDGTIYIAVDGDGVYKRTTPHQEGSSLDDLSDVDVSTTPPTAGQALVWDSGAGMWVPATVSGTGGAGELLGHGRIARGGTSASFTTTSFVKTALSAAFTAPASGVVLARVSCWAGCGSGTRMEWGLVDAANALVHTDAYSRVADQQSCSATPAWVVSGLTPGNPYTWYAAGRRIVGTGAALMEFGVAEGVMEVWAA